MKVKYRVIEHDPDRWYEATVEKFPANEWRPILLELVASIFHKEQRETGNEPKWPMTVEIEDDDFCDIRFRCLVGMQLVPTFRCVLPD